jgi:hypothetical protein
MQTGLLLPRMRKRIDVVIVVSVSDVVVVAPVAVVVCRPVSASALTVAVVVVGEAVGRGARFARLPFVAGPVARPPFVAGPPFVVMIHQHVPPVAPLSHEVP